MNIKDIIQSEQERFEKEFSEIRFGDGTSNGGGKSAWKIPKENLSIDELKAFLSASNQRVLEAMVEVCNKMIEKNKKFPMRKHIDIDNEIIEEYGNGYDAALSDLKSAILK
jgi:hypothetical protein